MSTIRWSPSTSILENGANGTVICGQSGSGKTFFALNTAITAYLMGQRVVILDPKNDFVKIKNICEDIKVIDINNVHEGALNPFTFLSNVDTAKMLSIIETLCGKFEKEETKIAVTPIIQDFIIKTKRDGTYTDMQEIADYLYSRDNKYAQAIGSQLKMYEDNQYGKLLFTRKVDVKPLRISMTDSMVISLHGMALPDESVKVEDYNAQERLTATILYLITMKLNEMLKFKNRVPSILFCDEAHLMYCNKEMATIMDKFQVIGRSLNWSIVSLSQGISHFPEGSYNNYATKFIFKSGLKEAELFLENFDTSKLNSQAQMNTNSVLSSIPTLGLGQCFMIDSKLRCGFVQIKSIYDVKQLSSNPLDKAKED